jgi:hypothetical protein
MSGLPESGHDWAIYEYTPSLTPLRDLGRSARQAPPHRLHAAGKFEARVGGAVVCPNAARLLRVS